MLQVTGRRNLPEGKNELRLQQTQSEQSHLSFLRSSLFASFTAGRRKTERTSEAGENENQRERERERAGDGCR